MKREGQFVTCVANKGYAASLEVRKIYQVIPDRSAAALRQVRSSMSRANLRGAALRRRSSTVDPGVIFVRWELVPEIAPVADLSGYGRFPSCASFWHD
jgi:hypothetical protein